jgi:NAD(P)-dependent dehydrogenase (short-subunit alcohol dehydrogenase family)
MPMVSKSHPPFTCDLSGKVVLVTGASGGIGAHLAQSLAAAGAAVAASARREAPLSEVVSRINAAGGRAVAIKLDVTDAADIEAAFERADAAFGTVDVLINNAGIAIGKTALETSVSEWDAVIATNLRGAFLVAQACAKRLVARKVPGSIVNLGSVLGERVAPAIASYAASKAGLMHLTHALALEWARYSIRVNAIAPGYIETGMNAEFLASPAGEALIKRIPQRRLGRLEDLDAPVLLLASDASAYITGAVLPIDGGHLVSSL